MFGKLPTYEELDIFKSTARFLPYTSGKLCPRRYTKGAQQRHDEHDEPRRLTMASYDQRPDDISLPNVVRQCIDLIATFPLMAVYGYQSYTYKSGKSLYIHKPLPELSTAENILALLRPDSSYSPLEARILDLCLVLHAEHGGGNNSTFTTHVVTSSGTDTYSCMSAARQV